MSTWVDSHCHLQERYLPGEDGADALEALRRARAAGVEAVVCVGTDEATSRQAVALAADQRGDDLPTLRAVVGLHPHEGYEDLRWLASILDDGDPAVVGVGECGLDYHYDNAPREAQRRSFAEQIAMAHEHDLALVIHARDAWDDLFDVLACEGVPTETVLHCFTGGPSEAARLVSLGITVSFSGIVTFKNADDLRASVAEVPLERLLIETDSPFLAPVPHRGQPHEPALVPLVGAAIAAVRDQSDDLVATATSANAARIFRL